MKTYSKFLLIGALSPFMLLFNSCNQSKENLPVSLNESNSIEQKVDTITSLSQFNGKKAIWKHGKEITIVEFVPYSEEEISEENMERKMENDSNSYFKTSSTSSTCSNSFAGTARKAAKTSYASVSYTTYSTITSLRSSLSTDTYMRTLGISSSSTSNRVTEEKENVNITSSYLYAISRESDNDYHIIIGNSTSASSLINVEVSGNPPSTQSSYSAINATRSYIVSYFGKDFCGSSGYTKFSPALTVKTLTGSMFFDVDHTAGTVGPTGLRPNSSWEIHPVKSISIQ